MIETSLPLSPQVFAILSALVEEQLGLQYRLEERDLLAERVSRRAVERGFESLLDYYYFLRYDAAAKSEFPRLAEELVVNETFFFREVAGLRLVAESFVPELLASGVRPRIWCAACATGEEPLTLAMLLDGAGLLDRVEIVASDINARALAHAAAGHYRRRSLRSLPPSVVGRWMVEHGDGMQVAPRLQEAISWRRVNLLETDREALGAAFDVVLCRNVFIYFSDKTISHVLSMFYDRMRPGGSLLVGAAESLTRFDVGFRCEERAGAFFYRREAP